MTNWPATLLDGFAGGFLGSVVSFGAAVWVVKHQSKSDRQLLLEERRRSAAIEMLPRIDYLHRGIVDLSAKQIELLHSGTAIDNVILSLAADSEALASQYRQLRVQSADISKEAFDLASHCLETLHSVRFTGPPVGVDEHASDSEILERKLNSAAKDAWRLREQVYIALHGVAPDDFTQELFPILRPH